jgi:thimet oligopeptidase
MEHGQVNTFFHEFGHLIHHLLAKNANWLSLSGIRVEWDFVETPSQLLEEWAQDHAVLARFAKHHETGEPIPAETVAKMNRAQEFGRGVGVMRQLFYAAYSFFVHDRSPEGLDLDAYSKEIYGTYSPYPEIEGSHIYASFGHLVGYSSQYYTYQWSLVIAKDLFSRFKTAGLLDVETAMAYRKLILEPGGMRDAGDMVKDFLDRDYSLDAYKAWLTTKTAAPAQPTEAKPKK